MRTETVPTTKEREGWIDAAKAIAMLFIILGHVGIPEGDGFSFQFVHGFHLVVFFLLSGYTFRTGPLSNEYLSQKFRRLMTPYFITCVFVLILDVFYELFLNGNHSIQAVTASIGADLLRTFYGSGSFTEIVTGLDTGARIGAIWFLPALFFALLIFRFLSSKIRDNKILGIVSAIVALAGNITARFIWLPFSVQSGLFAVFFLWLGFTIKKNDLLKKLKWYHYLIALIIFLGGIYLDFSAVYFVSANATDLLISTLVGICGAVLVYFLAKLLSKAKIVCWYGIHSLTFLCVHLVVLETFPLGRIMRAAGLSGRASFWGIIVLHLILVLILTPLVELFQTKAYRPVQERLLERTQNPSETEEERIRLIEWGLLVLAMIVGLFDIDPVLRSIIYSCYIAGFLFLSGSAYQKPESLPKAILGLVKKYLGTYLFCLIVHLLLNIPSWSGPYFASTLGQYAAGMSFSRLVLPDVASVGPLYLLLLMFLVQVFYLLIDHWVRNEIGKWIVVLLCTIAGIVLGYFWIWLPWGIDIALYGLLFYQFGVSFHKYGILEIVRKTHWLYFVLSAIWTFMIFKNGMEPAIRDYGTRNYYGVVIVGALSGILVIYRLSCYILQSMPIMTKVLSLIGKAGIVFLIIHVFFSYRLQAWITPLTEEDSFYLMLLIILIEAVAAVLIRFGIDRIPWKKKKALC
ncbi:MAG: acyltransferase family protein [Parasporobacterium sp.]|nr:acyltransferase family protein [Parasporobacterium sp.]